MAANKPTRADRLAWAKLHGYHGDTQAFTRLIVESRIARPALDAAWREGVQAKRNGGCVIKRPTGMHTNGGCKCWQDKIKAQRMMRAGQKLFDTLRQEKPE